MANRIWELLRRRYPEHEYALMAEVSDKAGFERSRSADYIAVSLWPSRGLAVNGIELKSFRSDWLNELKNPKKAENIFQYCDYFWLLTTDETIAKIEEIPPTWGWLCIKGERIMVKKQAPNLTPVPLSKSFMVAMLKRAGDRSKFVHKDSIKDEIDEAYQKGKNETERHTARLEAKLNELQTAVKEFEDASGLTINVDRWTGTPKQTGEAVKFLENGGVESIKEDLLRLEPVAQKILESISKGLKSIQPEVNNEPEIFPT